MKKVWKPSDSTVLSLKLINLHRPVNLPCCFSPSAGSLLVSITPSSSIGFLLTFDKKTADFRKTLMRQKRNRRRLNEPSLRRRESLWVRSRRCWWWRCRSRLRSSRRGRSDVFWSVGWARSDRVSCSGTGRTRIARQCVCYGCACPGSASVSIWSRKRNIKQSNPCGYMQLRNARQSSVAGLDGTTPTTAQSLCR